MDDAAGGARARPHAGCGRRVVGGRGRAVAMLCWHPVAPGGVAHGNRFACAVPKDRVAAAWAPDDAAIRGASRFTARSPPAAARPRETSWRRVSKVLDEYMSAWSAMYLQTCEATHVRGEQSAEVLDLRMSCLNDNLDQVRALTDTDARRRGRLAAVGAAQGLTPVSRCADVALLDRRFRCRRTNARCAKFCGCEPLKEIETLREFGSMRAALCEGDGPARANRGDRIQATRWANCSRMIGTLESN